MWIGEDLTSRGFADVFEVIFAHGLGEAASDDDDFGTEEIDDAAEGESEIEGGAFDFADDDGVAGLVGGGEVFGFESFVSTGGEFCAKGCWDALSMGFEDSASDGGAGGECFEATSAAAAAFGAVWFDEEVADFARVAG